ncbi:hypothetical protein [Methanobrevibacter olleyae]|uniref:Uncharacterized protein n=1 Tax=Methanobrevibacter olleyae TaxID=294671 RepID=A0A1I4FDU6_METOL|nr:hypothetical protein [Methanobrevibacter olleyae]SFL16145.1 hypothetical protein SAMN02910297_00072 [Methanobrevibacter olleyae]
MCFVIVVAEYENANFCTKLKKLREYEDEKIKYSIDSSMRLFNKKIDNESQTEKCIK